MREILQAGPRERARYLENLRRWREAGRDLPVLVGEAYNWQGAYQNNHVAAAYALLILGLSIGSTLLILRLLRVNREALA